MVHTAKKKSRIPLKIIQPLALFLLIGCLLAAGCINTGNRNTTPTVAKTPTITPTSDTTTPAVEQTTAPVNPGNSTNPTEVKKGLLNISIGDYQTEPPAMVFFDNVSVGYVSAGYPLNLTVATGRHMVKLCVVGACLEEPVIILQSDPTVLEFGPRLKQEVVMGPLRVSIGGYIGLLPVFVDNTSVGNVSNMKPLDLKIKEGIHNVRVCVGILCENETVEIKFAQPVTVEFEKRLKNVMEFSEPTIRIVDTTKNNNRVVVSVELINPTKKDLTMAATIQVAYSYINPQTHWRSANAIQGTVSRPVKAGARTVQNLTLSLTGGSSYISEVPVILDSSFV